MTLGWRPGDPSPSGAVLASASGAAFTTVVLAQTMNAFVCRSASRTPGELGWRTNPLLVAAVTIELTFSAAVLFITPVADLLGHATPPVVGWLIALGSMPLVLAVDRIDKHRRRRAAQASSANAMPLPGSEPARGSR